MEKYPYMLPLKESEFVRLRGGGDIIKTYHKPLQPLPLFVVVVSKKKYTEKDFKVIIQSGDSGTSIQLNDKQIDTLQEGKECMKVNYKEDIIVVIYSEEKFKEFMEAKARTI